MYRHGFTSENPLVNNELIVRVVVVSDCRNPGEEQP